MESKTWSGTVEWMRSDYKYYSGSDCLTFWVNHGCSLMQMNDENGNAWNDENEK